MTLSRSEMALLGFLRAHSDRHGYGPTIREMGTAIGMRSMSRLHRLLDGLEERGFIRRLKHRERAIELLNLPPVSRAPNGAPLFFIPVKDGSPLRGGAHR